MPEIGICKLCLHEGVELQKSHYVPAALYPRNAKLEYIFPDGNEAVETEITAPLLCRPCESRFGVAESEVLRHIAPKAIKKLFPLHDTLDALIPDEGYRDVRRYKGDRIGIDMDKFAYFMLSLVWRGAIYSWPKQKGDPTKPFELEKFEPLLRQYLLGEQPFPINASVIVIVCTDRASRELWYLPTEAHEGDGCLNFRFHAMGVYFRAVFGDQITEFLRRAGCQSAGKWIQMGSCERRTLEAVSKIVDL